jgi:hypothetical protein
MTDRSVVLYVNIVNTKAIKINISLTLEKINVFRAAFIV